MHPRDMENSAIVYYIREALKDAFVIDFLSDRAQDSLTGFLAVEMKSFYAGMPEWPKTDDPDAVAKRERYYQWEYKNTPFFEMAVRRHPLSAVFGDTLAKAVQVACDPIFAELERIK